MKKWVLSFTLLSIVALAIYVSSYLLWRNFDRVSMSTSLGYNLEFDRLIYGAGGSNNRVIYIIKKPPYDISHEMFLKVNLGDNLKLHTRLFAGNTELGLAITKGFPSSFYFPLEKLEIKYRKF